MRLLRNRKDALSGAHWGLAVQTSPAGLADVIQRLDSLDADECSQTCRRDSRTEGAQCRLGSPPQQFTAAACQRRECPAPSGCAESS